MIITYMDVIKKECLQCGVTFIPANKHASFCSNACHGDYRRSTIPKVCPTCKKLFVPEKHRRKIQKFCTKECRRLWCVGKNVWNWKGGVTSEVDKSRHSVAWRIWREDVFRRDNYVCQECGMPEGKLVPHHIVSCTHFPDRRFDVANGITLCKDCHDILHNVYGRNYGSSCCIIPWGIIECLE